MKKIFLTCLISLTAITCSILPAHKEVLAANSTTEEAFHIKAGILPAVKLPARDLSSIQLSYVRLAEREKWILDEVLCDYVSETVVELMESGIDYAIGDWIDQEVCTYLSLEKKLPTGSLYTVCGYTKADSGYVYFELSSCQPLTKQQVHREVERNFSENQEVKRGIC